MAAELELIGAVGYAGNVWNGLHVHPDREHVIYPVGNTVVIERIGGKRQQDFLSGHHDEVTAVAVSPNGRYIASGTESAQGGKADIIIWDYKSRQAIHVGTLHKPTVLSLAFSKDESLLASLGTDNDGYVVVWDVESGKPIAASATSNTSGGQATVVQWSGPSTFVTAGDRTVRVWELIQRKRLNATDVPMGGLKRNCTTSAIEENGMHAYFGTKSGDVLKVLLSGAVFKGVVPIKGKAKGFVNGVTSLAILKSGDLIVGSGNGTVAHVQKSGRIANQTKLIGEVRSIALRGAGHEFFAGTNAADIHHFSLASFEDEERLSGHSSAINDVKFPDGISQLYATCTESDLYVWQASSNKVLLKISVPGKTCTSFCFTPQGDKIITGWSDGVIRGFAPESGKQLFEMLHAHDAGVSAVALTHEGRLLVSGGKDGVVRLWLINKSSQQLLATLKEHKGEVKDIAIRSDGSECITASLDGSCIVWDLERQARSKVLFASTNFHQVKYACQEAQIMTCGADKKVHYWEAFNASLIREITMSASGTLTALALDSAAVNGEEGGHFIVSGQDKIVKVVDYNTCETTHAGAGHCSNVTKLALSPDEQTIVTVTSSGTIFLWKNPYSA